MIAFRRLSVADWRSQPYSTVSESCNSWLFLITNFYKRTMFSRSGEIILALHA
jgi:hypothetical protein